MLIFEVLSLDLCLIGAYSVIKFLYHILKTQKKNIIWDEIFAGKNFSGKFFSQISRIFRKFAKINNYREVIFIRIFVKFDCGAYKSGAYKKNM